jgi:hypothetical protein
MMMLTILSERRMEQQMTILNCLMLLNYLMMEQLMILIKLMMVQQMIQI